MKKYEESSANLIFQSIISNIIKKILSSLNDILAKVVGHIFDAKIT